MSVDAANPLRFPEQRIRKTGIMKLRLSINSMAISAKDAGRIKRALGTGPRTARCFRAGEMLETLSRGFQTAARHLFRAKDAPRGKCETRPGGFAAGRRLTQTIDTQENEINAGFGAFLLADANARLMADLKLGLDPSLEAFRDVSQRANNAFLELATASETRRVSAEEITAVDDLLRRSGTAAVRLIRATGDACKLDTTSTTIGIPTVRK